MSGQSGRSLPLAVLPTRPGDPPAPPPRVSSPDASPTEILRCAETLGIPWRRVLLEEIEAEQKLRRYMPDLDRQFSLPHGLTVLSFSLLHSWRLRDRVEGLACEARGASIPAAIRQLRIIFQHLIGAGGSDPEAVARHFWVAYQRVLLLQRARRIAAATGSGTMEERLALVCSRASCSFEDAAWALSQPALERRGRRLELAMRKVREEGFLIPRAESEARAFAQLRRITLTSPQLASTHRSRRRPQGRAACRQRPPLSIGGAEADSTSER